MESYDNQPNIIISKYHMAGNQSLPRFSAHESFEAQSA
jgi:hypothetical protein